MTILTKRVYRKIKQDVKRDELIRAMDAIDNLRWSLPANLRRAKWARLDIDTSGRDALRAATNVFSAFLPTWDVMPRGPADKENAERYERWLEWCYMLMNNRGESTVTWSAMKSAAKFDVVVARVDYLPYYIQGEPTKRQKLALRDGVFAAEIYHPLDIHYEISKWGLEWVGRYSVIPAEEVLAHWQVFANKDDKEKGGAQVAAAISRVKAYIQETGPEKKARLAVLDYTDLDQRYVIAFKVDNDRADPELLLSEKPDIVILDIENELPFNNWIVSVGGTSFEKEPEDKIDPLLAPLHKANLWSNQNLHESLQTSKVLKRYGFPDMIVYTATGEKKRIDFTGETNTLTMRMNAEKAEAVQAPVLDPGLQAIVDRGRGRMSSTTGVKVLQDLDISGNLQFATVQALLQMALGQLTPAKNVAEKALSQVGRRMLEWLAFTGDKVPAWYTDDYGEADNRKQGAQIKLSVTEKELDTLLIKCSLKENTPTNKQQRINQAVLANQRLGVPRKELVEDLGYGSPEVLENEFIKEQLLNAAIQTFIETQRAQAIMKLRQAQGATGAPGMEGQVPGPQGMPSPSQENISGEGFNQALGGETPLGGDQGLTREGVTGRSITGMEGPGL